MLMAKLFHHMHFQTDLSHTHQTDSRAHTNQLAYTNSLIDHDHAPTHSLCPTYHTSNSLTAPPTPFCIIILMFSSLHHNMIKVTVSKVVILKLF